MTLFKVRGVPVKVGWSWLLIFLLVLWSLATSLFPSTYPGLSASAYLLMAAVATVLFFGSVLVHELSHTLRSLREGVHVRQISLWLFGGVSQADEPLPGPGAEFRVVVAGPVASAALAVLFLALAAGAQAAGLPTAWVAVPEYLARINGLLLAFNLVPALPLDGGRLLHALLWWRSGDNATATIYAATAGRVFGAVLVAIGLISMLAGQGLGGLWFVVLGWFLMQAVRQEVLSARVTQAFTGLRVRDLMSTRLVTVDVSMTVADFGDLLERGPSHPAYPVLDQGDLVGLLLLRRAGEVPLEQRSSVRVREVMVALDQIPVVYADDLIVQAARVLAKEPGRAVVREYTAGPVVGLLSSTDLSRALDAAARRPARARRSRTAAVLGFLASAAVLLAGAVIYHPPFVVLSPGESFDVRGDITITGIPVQPPSAPYLVTSVRLSQPNTLSVLVAALRNDRQVLPLGDVLPTSVSPEVVDQMERRLYAESQQTAAVAAARAAGFNARLTGGGARVLGFAASSPAEGVLRVADTITAVDGAPVQFASDLRDAVAGHPAGETIHLTLVRGGRALRVDVENARLPQVSGGTGLGIVVDTKDLHAVLPFRITFRERLDIGGPSAGLAYALVIADILDKSDDAKGRAVAATGTIASGGAIGPVGGVEEKAIAAREAGAKILLVPDQELPSAANGQIDVVGVKTLQQALDFLRGSSGGS
jgi:PDZ domain-containing secreted protein/Zn-dependent protease/CBS domain-containing protein